MATKNPYGRSDKANERANRDREVAADPDIRGVSKGRLGRMADERNVNQDTPERVEREWRRR